MKQNETKNGKLDVPPSTPQNSIARFRKLVNSKPASTCPFLGLKEDPETLTNYASEDNFCHCKGHARAVPLDYQQMTCLFNYGGCPVFLNHMAAEVHAREKLEGRKNGHALKPAMGMVTILTNLLGIK